LCLSGSLCVLFLAVSVNPNLSGLLGGFFDILQFPYRLTTYINLALLVCIFAVAGLLRWDQVELDKSKNSCKNITLVICVAISLCAMVSKLIHASAIRSTEPPSKIQWLSRAFGPQWSTELAGTWYPGIRHQRSRLIRLPMLFYGYFAYSVTVGFSTSLPAGSYEQRPIAFMPEDSGCFGRVHSINFEVAEPTLVVTNIQAFPWNRLAVDGVEQPISRLYTLQSNAFAKWALPVVEAVLLPKGKHVLRYRFSPDKAWRILDRTSWITLVAWFVFCLVAGLVCYKRGGHGIGLQYQRNG
jgi:hypothetical protein